MCLAEPWHPLPVLRKPWDDHKAGFPGGGLGAVALAQLPTQPGLSVGFSSLPER